jgi:hypothetical protein
MMMMIVLQRDVSCSSLRYTHVPPHITCNSRVVTVPRSLKITTRLKVNENTLHKLCRRRASALAMGKRSPARARALLLKPHAFQPQQFHSRTHEPPRRRCSKSKLPFCRRIAYEHIRRLKHEGFNGLIGARSVRQTHRMPVHVAAGG